MRSLFLAALLALAASPAGAAPDSRGEKEIAALLAFVEASPCKFVRGGTEYDGKAAREHLARKLDVARPMIDSADAFIERVASASSISGEPYGVRCAGRETTSKAWLGTELARMRRGVKAQ